MGIDTIVPITLAVLFCISFILAFRSMKDLKFGQEVAHMVFKKKMKGSIVFFDKKVVHYKGSKR
jgi:hypothetical protein